MESTTLPLTIRKVGDDVSKLDFDIHVSSSLRDVSIQGILEIYNEAIRNTTATFDTEEKTFEERFLIPIS